MRELEARYGGVIPWIEVTAPMMVAGEEVRLAGMGRGIFRPRQMSRGALSIKTTVPRAGRTRRYDDIASDEGFFEYRFMGDDPKHADNRALQESWHDRRPSGRSEAGVRPASMVSSYIVRGHSPTPLPGLTVHGRAGAKLFSLHSRHRRSARATVEVTCLFCFGWYIHQYVSPDCTSEQQIDRRDEKPSQRGT